MDLVVVVVVMCVGGGLSKVANVTKCATPEGWGGSLSVKVTQETRN